MGSNKGNIMLKENKILLGYFCALLATIFWSGNFIVARDVREAIDPISLSFYRWVVAVAFLLPFAIKASIKKYLLIKKHFIYLSIVSVLGVSIFNTFLYIAAHSSPAINLSIISITFPIIIIILSRIFLKEQISINKLIGVFTVFTGVLLLISKGKLEILINLSFTAGDIWVAFAALSFAIYSIILKYKPQEFKVIDFQLITFTLGTIYLIPFFLYEYDIRVLQDFNTTHMFSILYIGIFASLFAFILWNKAVELVGATKAGLIYYTLPIFTGTLAFIFLDEQITYIHLVSIIFIFIGIYITNKTKKEKI